MSERTGEALRDEGIQRAADHANRVEPKWTDQAYAALEAFLKLGPFNLGHKFTSEDVRRYAAGPVIRLPDPPHLRAWGAVFQRAVKAGLIVKRGTTTAVASRVHCSIITVWRKAE